MTGALVASLIAISCGAALLALAVMVGRFLSLSGPDDDDDVRGIGA